MASLTCPRTGRALHGGDEQTLRQSKEGNSKSVSLPVTGTGNKNKSQQSPPDGQVGRRVEARIHTRQGLSLFQFSVTPNFLARRIEW